MEQQTKLNTYQNNSSIYEYEDIYSRDRVYSDFDLRLIKHPLNNNLVTLKEENAVQRALVNLILTEPGEKPFHPNFGTPLNGLLFNIDLLNPLDIEDQIQRSINLFEPRVHVKKIKVIDVREFNDYDFESSGMNIFLDVLAYNTQMNSMTAHLALNENFLDTVQARPNIVSLAKQLGYTPTSVSCALASIDLVVVPPESYSNNVAYLRQNSIFSGGQLNWYVTQEYSTNKNVDGNFVFSDVLLREGNRKIIRYYFDNKNPYAKFEIPDRDVDITTVQVKVKESESTNFYTIYEKFSVFSSIDESSPVYFIEENPLGLYEIYFTGGNVGISPKTGNIIEIEYFYGAGETANGINTFNTDVNITETTESKFITTILPGYGGGDKEEIESIRFNSSHYYEAQNRCVTYKDYASIIKKEYPQTETINVWGGEDNTPAEYGRVYICIKPSDGDILSDESKDYILNEILEGRRVATISPRIIDPEYTYIGLDVVSKYDETKTTNTPQKIIDIIREAILLYETNSLKTFNGVFRHSQLLRIIDSSEFSIQNTSAIIYLIKKIPLTRYYDNVFQLFIPTDFYDYDSENVFVKSSIFRLNNRLHYITDRKDSSDSNKRQLILVYTGSGGTQIVENVDIGYINISERTIYLYGFNPDIDITIDLYINPKTNDVVPLRNQLLQLDKNKIKIQVEKDFLQTENSLGIVRNTPTNRNITLFE